MYDKVFKLSFKRTITSKTRIHTIKKTSTIQKRFI